jgi:hypothetical protein
VEAGTGFALSLGRTLLGRTMEADDAIVQSIVRQVTAYVSANPHGSDTPAGIARWWLGAGGSQHMETVERALEVVQGRGIVESIDGLDGRIRYRSRLAAAEPPVAKGH